MSTKCSIFYLPDEHSAHLYGECFEKDGVWLEMVNVPAEIRVVRNIDGDTVSMVRVRIPQKVYDEIIRNTKEGKQ